MSKLVSVVVVPDNTLFIHVPKTAGGSISRALLKKPGAARYAVTNMSSAEPCVEQLQKNLQQPISAYRSITCVRNPWDWTVSGYLQVTQNMSAYLTAPPFHDFLLGDWRLATERAYPSKFTNAIAYVAYHTQIAQWTHLGGREGIDSIDVVCRFETLEADLDEAFGDKLSVPHIHQSSRVHYSKYFDDELADLVYQRNENLIHEYGYTFETS